MKFDWFCSIKYNMEAIVYNKSLVLYKPNRHFFSGPCIEANYYQQTDNNSFSLFIKMMCIQITLFMSDPMLISYMCTHCMTFVLN